MLELYHVLLRRAEKENPKFSSMDAARLRFKIIAASGGAVAVVFAILWPTGYFGPLSSRVRGLFVQHTRTGNIATPPK